MEQIRNFLQSIVNLSDNDWLLFSSRLKKQYFHKKSFLLKTMQIENYLSFMEKGIVRYVIDKEVNDLTFGFSFENEFVSAYDSFLTQTPCVYSIETLTDTIVWQLSYTDLQEIYTLTELGNIIGRLMAEELLLKKSKREISLLHDTAEQRYSKLFTERPNLIRQIPLKYIASYIGITPQALSRIRKHIS